MTKTFFGLIPLADLSAKSTGSSVPTQISLGKVPEETKTEKQIPAGYEKTIPGAGLHYNVQIHLPATKDVEVYNAIFKSLKEHLFE